MELGKFFDGHSFTFDEATKQFSVGGAPVSPQDILAYDRGGQLTWASDDLRNWAYQYAANTELGHAAMPPRRGWFTRLPMWAKILFVIFYPASIPYGIWAMWKERRFTQPARVALTAVAGVFLIAVFTSAAGKGSSTASTSSASSTAGQTQTAPSQPVPAVEQAPEPAAAPAAAPTPPPTPAAAEPEPAPEPAASALTLGQEQAVQKAQNYLDMGGFSKKSLVKQLEFEGFSTADSKFAVDYIAPDWNAQAVQKAESYMEMGGFSRSSLIKQLEFEGFTESQAKHGAKAVGY